MPETITSRDVDAAVDVDDGLHPINAEQSMADYLRSMWGRREFAIEVPLEEMRNEHKTTLLGNVWHLGNPLLTIGVYYLVFGTLLAGRRPDNFLLWLTVGLFAFRLSQKSMLSGAKSLRTNSGLMKAIRFPRALLPVSAVSSQLLGFGFELGILAVLVPLYGWLGGAGGADLGISKRWLLLPLVVLVHTCFNLGAAFITARLNDSFRDIEQLIPFLFQLLRYLSGVMVPIDSFIGPGAPTIAKLVLALNPLAAIIEMYRWVFLAEAVDMAAVARTTVISVGLLWFGFRYFRAAEWKYGRQ